MTRREWLAKNPPPKAAKQLRDVLEHLVQENNGRALLEGNKITYGQHIAYWNQQAANARQSGDTVTLNQANAQLGDFQNKIAEIDRQLAATAGLAARIEQLKSELPSAARCSTHNLDLVRHKNRPDDLFLCEVGPHFFLWTSTSTGPKLLPVDLAKSLPGIDEQVTEEKSTWV